MDEVQAFFVGGRVFWSSFNVRLTRPEAELLLELSEDAGGLSLALGATQVKDLYSYVSRLKYDSVLPYLPCRHSWTYSH